MKKISFTITIIFLSLLVFAEDVKKAPSLFGIQINDSVSKVRSELQRKGLIEFSDKNGAILFLNPNNSVKFGEQPIGAVAINYQNGRCIRIGGMHKNGEYSPILYRKAIKSYLSQFSDVETVAEDEKNKSDDIGFYSYWIISQKYIFYSEEEVANGMTSFALFDKSLFN